MLSLPQCRRILETESRLSDAEIEHVREQVGGLADVIIEAFLAQRRTPETVSEQETGGWRTSESALSDNDDYTRLIGALGPIGRDAVEERAAIMEFDAGLDRNLAERKALSEYLQRISQKVSGK